MYIVLYCYKNFKNDKKYYVPLQEKEIQIAQQLFEELSQCKEIKSKLVLPQGAYLYHGVNQIKFDIDIQNFIPYKEIHNNQLQFDRMVYFFPTQDTAIHGGYARYFLIKFRIQKDLPIFISKCWDYVYVDDVQGYKHISNVFKNQSSFKGYATILDGKHLDESQLVFQQQDDIFNINDLGILFDLEYIIPVELQVMQTVSTINRINLEKNYTYPLLFDGTKFTVDIANKHL